MGRSVSVASLALTCVLAACLPKTTLPSVSDRGLPLADLSIKRSQSVLLTLQVELAETPEAQAKGLMGIKKLSDSQGMAFINSSPSSSPFYMKNTLIPLDIAFWNEEGSIVDIIQMEPCRADPCRLYYAAQSYIGAVEMNQGLLRRKAAAIGDRVNLKRRR